MAKRSVLFVEDDPDDVRLTLMALKDVLAPYEVVRADDGVQALDYLIGRDHGADSLPVLIIVDINLPRINGVELLQRLREAWGPGLRGVKVVVLSSSYMEQERGMTAGLGVAAHLRKPLSRAQNEEIAREIARLLAEG